ncbi:MAGUK p55 subfamily member 7 [Clonorchis sinensis]|uniref:MAGUK p55 subfamily member 7 n=1 Tax=Clonorchis sinensis TaxID=79923 RepID=G7YQ60_CLOSI|nr:MAGUK p55 subfamily member 7 [Clonorchis sinensis]
MSRCRRRRCHYESMVRFRTRSTNHSRLQIVTLIKEDEPLGATVKINEHNGTVSVTRIMSGGAADRSKAIDAGDAIRKINGIAVQGKGPMEVVQLLLKTTGEVKLNLTPSTLTQKTPDQNQVHVRTLFSYSPLSDPLIPHPEAGLAFLKGEILRLIKTDDPNWWKAIKVEFAPGGPVASVLGSNANQPGLGRVGLIPSKSHKAWWKLVYFVYIKKGRTGSDLPNSPPGVGKTELVQQLINTDPTHFREPIRITTRKPREGEVHGVDYLFVTDDEFNTFVEAESLIDQSPVTTEGAIGLCLDAVLEIIQAGQVAVFEADYRNLRLVRSSILKPFVIFIKPPALDVLLETRMVQRSPGSAEASTSSSTPSAGASPARSVPTTPRLTGSYRANRRLGSLNLIRLRQSLRKSDEELGSLGPNITSSLDQLRLTDHFSKSKLNETQLHEMLQIAARLEVSHGHMWDYVLINDDLPVALEQLSELAYRIETEAFWVPSMWVTAVDSSSTEQLKSDPSGSMVAIK